MAFLPPIALPVSPRRGQLRPRAQPRRCQTAGRALPQSVTASLRVAVIGAGTAGATAALLLQRQSHHVTLFERAANPRVEGCGVLLRGNALDYLQDAGLNSVVDAINEAAQGVNLFSYRTMRGKLVSEEPPGPDATRRVSLLVRRADVLRALWQPFERVVEGKGGATFCGHRRLVRVEERGNEVVATFEDGFVWTGDLLIGADGIRSETVKYVAPERMFNYLGDRVWRGVAPDDELCKDAMFIVYIRAGGIYANCFDLGRDAQGCGWTHWGLFRQEEYPRKASERKALREEGVPEDLLSRVPKEFAKIVRRTEKDKLVQGYEFDIDTLPRYVRGRVALIGDAAHSMSSTLAWGMGSGIGDAVCLAKHLEGEDSLHDALRKYEEERLPTTHGYQNASRKLSEKFKKNMEKVRLESL